MFNQGCLQRSYALAAEAFDLDNENVRACSQLLQAFQKGYGSPAVAYQAVECLEKASVTFPALGHDLGNYYSEQGNIEKAIASFLLATQHPSLVQPMTAMNLGTLYSKERRFAEAEACFGQALEAGLVAEASVNLGMVCFERGDVEKAELYWKRAWSECHVPEAAVNLGRLQRSRGDLASAMGFFKEALARGDRGAALDLGDVYAEQGDLSRAAAAYKIAMSFTSNGAHDGDDDIRRVAASKFSKVQEKQAYQAKKAGQFDVAVNLYEAARHAGSARAAFNLGKLKDQQGSTRAALDLYKEAWSKGCYEAGNHLGVTYEELGMFEEANQVYRDGHDKGDAQSSYNLGTVYMDKFKTSHDPADLDNAMQFFEAAHSKGHAGGTAKLGWWKHREGDEGAALSLFEEAKDKGDPSAILTLAELASKSGDAETADELFEELRASPDACHIWASREFFVGAGVTVIGLTSTEGRKLNCREGYVAKAFDDSTGRVGVKLEGDDHLKAIKAKNLQLKTSSIPARPLREEVAEVPNDISCFNAQLCASLLDNMERIVLLQFNRHDKLFEAALSDDVKLAACKTVLQQAGFPWKLETGTMVFVQPWQYAESVSALRVECAKLRPWHILVSESLEPAVQAALDSLPCRAGARVKQRSVITSLPDSGSPVGRPRAKRWWSLCSRRLSHQQSLNVYIHATDDAEAPRFPLCVKRTFICRQAILRDARAVVNSSTEAHGGINPRRLPVSSQGSSARSLS